MIKENQSEFANAPLGDRRLQRRLESIGAAVATSPATTFPGVMRSDSELEGLYRFLNNDRITPEAILQPHVDATRVRIQDARIAIVHDTTDFKFTSGGEALGFLPTTGQHGFQGHVALAVGESGDVRGVLAIEPTFAETRKRGRVRSRTNKSAVVMMYRRKKDKVSLRWDRMVERTRSVVANAAVAIHVMDCEADNYRLLSMMIAKGDRFVVRVRHDRRPAKQHGTDDNWEYLGDIARAVTHVCEREVHLSKRRRKPKLNATYGPREARMAVLRLSATSVTIKKPRGGAVLPTLSLNIVRVHEIGAPADGEPVEWLLLTTEPVTTRAEIEDVVDWYRRRWVIEEFFRALKTGCAFERRQLESRSAVLRTLFLLAPIAWQLLSLRDAARADSARPARSVLGAQQLAVLRKLSNDKLPNSASVEDAFLAIAAQGGHLKRNGRPGWQTLGRGLEKLWWAEFGYRLALDERKKK